VGAHLGALDVGRGTTSHVEGAVKEQLPNWVYDVVVELERWADEHPVLCAETFDCNTGGFVMARVDDCGCRALSLVPLEVRGHAAILAGYLSRAVREAAGVVTE
jgi:hypothetical protein